MRLTEPANDINDLYFIHGDQSGSTVLITDDTGQELGRAHYEPFGETFSSTIPMTLTERLFSGQILDSSTGLYYYGHGRYYDSTIGRYISPDPYLDAPFSSQRLDRYNFGFNNPLRYQRGEALPDFTVDLAKGTLVAEGLPAAALTSSFGQVAVDVGAARRVVKEVLGAVADAGQQSVLGGFSIGRITISASKTRLTTMLPGRVQGLFRGIPGLKGTYTKQTVSSGILAMSEGEIAEIRAAIEPLTVVKAGRGTSSRWAARTAERFLPLEVVGSFVVAGAVDVGFSLWQDIPLRDVYGLTNQQIAVRALVRGFGGGISAGIVMGLGAGIFGTLFPPLWFAIPVFVCAELFYEQLAVPGLYSEFQLYGAYEPRVHHLSLDPASLNRRRFIH
jgi:RHS repeat-associated protein